MAKDKKKPQYKKQERGYPYLSEKDAETVSEAEDDFVRWYSDPNTRRLFPDGSSVGLDEGIQKALDSRIQTGYTPGADARYESGYPEEGYPDTITLGNPSPDVVGHELTHAAQFDDSLGLQLMDIWGDRPIKGSKSYYYNKPGELYGNFHQVRLKLGIQPWERSFTPAKLLELIQFQGLENDPDIQNYMKSVGPQKFSEALNKIASVEADSRRLERLNFTPDDSVIMRPSSTYT